MRSKTKEIRIGKVKIGGDNPIAVQSMCNTDTKDAASTIKQIIPSNTPSLQTINAKFTNYRIVKSLIINPT